MHGGFHDNKAILISFRREKRMEKAIIHVSVRNLVEFILRSGDIDRRRGQADQDAMQKGGRLHRKIQNLMGTNYRAEVALKDEIEYGDLLLTIEGRADGIETNSSGVMIDEIKGVYLDVLKMEQPVLIHKAQAMCYAAIFLKQNEAYDRIEIQMTYGNLKTEQIKRFKQELLREELLEWYQRLHDEYHKWLAWRVAWKKERDCSILKLNFPFDYRKGQKKIVAGVYHSIQSGKQIFIQAPTGTGKTMAAVFPSLRALGEGKGDMLFYLTAKTITRTVAWDAFQILNVQGLKFKVIVLTARDRICFQDEATCNPETCEYAKGHFDRVNDAVFELLTTAESFDREIILKQAEKWKVCPFELSLDLSSWSDGVICDYNYVFDPDICLKRFFADGVKGQYLYLIDEAHNLVDRGREMYSATLYKEDVLAIRRLFKDTDYKKLYRALSRVNEIMLQYKRECETYLVKEHCNELIMPLLNLLGEMDLYLEENKKREIPEELMDFYFVVRSFLNISELVDENYVIYSETEPDGEFKVRQLCVNPARNLQRFMGRAITAVFFSATFLPLSYYKRLFSVEEEVYAISAMSPFSEEKRFLMIGNTVSTKYTRRSAEEYQKIAEYVKEIVAAKSGNYMVFFPSYKLMEDVAFYLEKEAELGEWDMIRQKTSMSESDRDQFLLEFQRTDKAVLGLCVLGGLFSEGIDLIGEQLIGSIVVGTGLPQVSNEREILKQFYDKNDENGFDYAYRFPGMNKVLQAAGRVIRTDEDYGVIALLDERFLQYDYRALFPEDWRDIRVVRKEQCRNAIQKFWENSDS